MAGNKSEDNWKYWLREKFPDKFKDATVLDIGAGDINGNNRTWFADANEYIGLDVVPYANVDVVSIAHEYYPDRQFDIVCSTSALEHDMYWEKTLQRMVELTTPGGLMWFSCCFSWLEHGTNKTTPHQSLTTNMGEEWATWYHNVTPKEVLNTIDTEKEFFAFSVEVPFDFNGDTRFWGVKK